MGKFRLKGNRTLLSGTKPFAEYISLRFIVVLTLFISTQLSGQPGDKQTKPAGKDIMNTEVTTASKLAEKVSEAPAVMYIITRDEIRDRGYSFLKDALRDVAGMETIENYYSESGTLVPVRGVAANNLILFLVNGTRVNPPGGENYPLRSDFSIRNAERIEIVYGPAVTLYGQDAVSAVVNVITEKAREDTNARIDFIGGTGSHKETMLSLSRKFNLPQGGTLNLSTYLHYLDKNLDDFSETYPEWWKNYTAIAGSIGKGLIPVRWDKGLNMSVRLESRNSSLQVWHRESSRSAAEGGRTPIIHFVDESVWHDRSTLIEARHMHNLATRVELETSFTYNRYEIDPESRYVWPASETTFYYNDFKYGIGTSLSLEEKLTAVVSNNFSLTAGFEAANYDILPKATIPGGVDKHLDISSQGGRFSYYTIQGNPGSKVVVPRAHNLIYQNYAGYFEARIQASEKLTFFAGTRFDANTRLNKVHSSTKLAAVSQINKNLTAKYVFSRGFISPAPYFGYNIFDNGTILNTANPYLDEATAISNEFNLTCHRVGFLLSGSFYYNRQDDLIITASQGMPINVIQPTVWLDEAGTVARLLTHSVNGGKSESIGVDLFLNYKAGRHSVWGSYSYVDVSTDIGGTKSGLDNLSASNFRLGATIKPLNKLTLTPSLVYRSTLKNVSRTFNLDDEIDNPYEINLYLVYSALDKFDFFLDLRNLTDNQYALKGAGGLSPQEGLKLAMGFNWYY